MYLLGFFFLARFSFDLPKPNFHGFTLVELMVCLSVSAILVGFALPSVWRWQERARRVFRRVMALRNRLGAYG